jgi:hypothetical protein
MRIFFHQAIFFMFGNRKKSRGLNLENTVDVAATGCEDLNQLDLNQDLNHLIFFILIM